MFNLKRVLITGANSYVGTNVEKWLMREPHKYYVETLDMMNPNWRKFDFSKFDVVFHVAGIAHARSKRKNRKLFYSVNHDLAVAVAEKASESGVSHFIFMSSMSVYGVKSGLIDENTPINPRSDYGISKYQAEKDITKYFSDKMLLTILRPPLIYGYKAPGNFNKLSRFIKKIRLVSDFHNQKSMIFIDNFANLIRIVIESDIKGVLMPQNDYNMSTMDSCRMILEVNGMKYHTVNLINPILSVFSSNLLSKIFGNLSYSQEISNFELNYAKVGLLDSIIKTERGEA